MANIKSSQKRAKQNVVRRQENLRRKSELKTAVKKVLASIANGDESTAIQELLRDAEAKFARAKGKEVLHPRAAARRTGRLAKKVAQATRQK